MGSLASKVGVECCTKRDRDDVPPGGDRRASILPDELQEELRVSAERERLLNFVEEKDAKARRTLVRYYSCLEAEQLEDFAANFSQEPPTISRSNTLIGAGLGPWGISSQIGGRKNSWDTVDAAGFAVRGPLYLSDRVKQTSGPSLAELLVVDLFLSPVDIPAVSQSNAARTVQRLRRDGEKRRLFVLNFRLVPLHVVAVWALPEASATPSPAQSLLSRFLDDMTDAERSTRLKVIPKVVAGPWVVRRLVGENHPAILGRGIPLDYYSTADALEVSVGIASSAAAQRVAKAMLRAGSALAVELALVIEGKTEGELPEQVLGGFSVFHADMSCLREVDSEKQGDFTPAPSKESVRRPAGLPSAD
mmetsp:Transcript_122501/g.354079  ORF Transcript_122501/g.354079 Transcript_122501/m.354079 type:complete len:363 (-) Transcript_122501:30-1118(-)